MYGYSPDWDAKGLKVDYRGCEVAYLKQCTLTTREIYVRVALLLTYGNVVNAKKISNSEWCRA